MSALIESLNTCLSTQTDDGLVNFNEIAKALTSVRDGIPRLLNGGFVSDVKTSLINMNGGREDRVVSKRGTTYFVDRRLAIAFIKKQKPYLKTQIQQWETKYGRADVPELLLRIPGFDVHLAEAFSTGHFRSVYKDGKWLLCLHDVVQTATGDQPHNGRNLAKVFEIDDLLEQDCRATHKFR